ncbi:GNAT family N-acetyltransferase [Paenibacillus sp. TH7-28]
MKIDFPVSDKLHLRLTAPEDIEFVLAAEQDEQNRQFITLWTKERHLQALDQKDCLHIIIEDVSHRPVGFAMLFGIESSNQNIELRRIVIVDKGKGYGKEALELVKKLVFTGLRAHRLWLDVKDFNLRAQHVYESAGFQIEGKLRECVKVNDRYDSLFVMGMLDREYFGRS